MPIDPNTVTWDETPLGAVPDPSTIQWDEPAKPPPRKPFRIDWSLGREDVDRTVESLKRLGLLITSGVNNAVVSTASIPADVGVEVRNVATGANYKRPSQMFADWQAESIAPPQNFGEELIQGGAGFAAGTKIPLPGAQARGVPSPAQETAEVARSAGYKLPPSEVPSSSTVSRAAERVAGPKQVVADAAKHNVPKSVENVAEDLGLPKGTELTRDALRAVRNREMAAGYEPLARLGQQYADLIAIIREARERASGLFRDYARNQRFETLQEANAAHAAAEQAEGVLEGSVRQLGRQDLYENYVQARKMIAKSGDVDRALVESVGEASAAKLSRDFGKQRPQSGALLALGRTAQAVPKAFREGSEALLTWPTRILGALGIAGAGGGAAFEQGAVGKTGNALLALIAAREAARAGARKYLMSDFAQDSAAFLTPEQRRAALARSVAATYAGANSQ